MAAGKFVNNGSFALTKTTIPFQLENSGDRNASALANQLVAIDKIALQQRCQLLPMRGLTRTHQSDEKNIACHGYHGRHYIPNQSVKCGLVAQNVTFTAHDSRGDEDQ